MRQIGRLLDEILVAPFAFEDQLGLAADEGNQKSGCEPKARRGIGSDELFEWLEVGVVVLPGRVDDTRDAGVGTRRAEPVGDERRVQIVVAGYDLAVAEAGEELQ